MSVKVPYVGYASILIHRVLAGHKPWEKCSDCPALCHHCGDVGRAGTDHTCTCPFKDTTCPNHPPLTEGTEG